MTGRSSSQAGLATFVQPAAPTRCPAVERLTDEGHTDLHCVREAGHDGMHRQGDTEWCCRRVESNVEVGYEWGVVWTPKPGSTPVWLPDEATARAEADDLTADGYGVSLVRRRVDRHPWEVAR